MMNRLADSLPGYLAYKNKLRIAEWEERLWQQHLHGALPDRRTAEERQRYRALTLRVQQLRQLAERLHRLRNAQSTTLVRFTAVPRDEPAEKPVTVTRLSQGGAT